ncbi:MBL fold metallo-hydrolase [Daejeonella sp.]|uniref:MBL fold metallo-hydrolase n=1 Tax=Daejeonella sp. TaxID=2805397 RepID=UPI00271AB532|nr:MBL fold metallo-hydrolase [Daejeonella sp.]MDO8994552.1 MBL fold metallo-hydrolase [Daejeonella sp.]MDP2415737.1 MBL fold metallo-hydrolase [Daejeonella sp.]
MKAFALYEGSYSVDNSKTFIPFDPVIHNPKDRPASLFVYVQPFLVETGNDLIILDTGLGFQNEQGELIIHENIRKAGYDPADVSLVLMSHLHFDHAGGMINHSDGKLSLSFPNAEYVIQRGEWEAAYSKPSRSYKTEIFDFVQRSGSVHFIEGSGQFNREIAFELTGGHCEYHQVFLIREDEETIFFGADILPEPEQLLRKFIAKYDFDGRKSMELRQEYGKRAAEEYWNCLFYHAKSKAIAKVAFENEAFRIL